MKKVIVISGANLFSGGTLSIMQNCLKYLDACLASDYRIIALINNAVDFKEIKNIELIEISAMRKSYFHRLYYEYFDYKSLSRELNPYLWFSLNDMSSNIKATKRAVYCHNPSPFRKLHFKDIFDQPQLFFFTLFYKYLYKINIHKNNYVIVQQNWIKKKFVKFYGLKPEKIVVARPLETSENTVQSISARIADAIFFYPAVPRPFKNFEVIIKAVKILTRKKCNNFKVVLTFDGMENNYAKRMIALADGVAGIEFTGLLSRNEVDDYYALASCLLFPSKLETWGLPITEFKAFDKSIFLADLPYAKETLGKYEKAVFFDPDDAHHLADLMFKTIQAQPIDYAITTETEYVHPCTTNWQQLFDLLLIEKNGKD
ncbi:MAG: glycosyltransferase family 1 protein [Bacteroidota bacterium]